MKIGLIGDGIHSKRIQKILKKKKLKYLIYKPQAPKYKDPALFKKLSRCEIIFILTPNHNHFEYLKKFYPKKFIFCEKPPVTKVKDLNSLKKMNNGKIYFNFNFRFLKLSNILQKKDKYNLGNLIYANLILSHGLALKKEYKKSWRSNKAKSPKGIFEIVTIHLVDMLNFIFKIKKMYSPSLLNLSKIGNSYDSSHTKIELSNNAIANIYSTYKSSYTKKFFFLFDNGNVEFNDGIISINGPAKNFNKNGFFIKPKNIKRIKINDEKDYLCSLEESVNFFLGYALKKKIIPKNHFDMSLKANSFILS